MHAQTPGHGPAAGKSEVCCRPEPGLGALLSAASQCGDENSSAPVLFTAFCLAVWHFGSHLGGVCVALFPPSVQNWIFSYCCSIGPFPRKSKYFYSLEVGVSYTLKLCFLPGYTALERRGNKEISIRGQLIIWQQEAEPTRHLEIAVVFEPGCWGCLSIQKLFRLMWTHLYVLLFLNSTS